MGGCVVGGLSVARLHPRRVRALLLLRDCRLSRRLQSAPAPEWPQAGLGISEGQRLREPGLVHGLLSARRPSSH
eukprot:scaffold104387_cov57-Phaeocystis_antarctica.AAC.3